MQRSAAPLCARMHEAGVLYVTVPSSAGYDEAPKSTLLWAHSLHNIVDGLAQQYGLFKVSQDCTGSFVLATGVTRDQQQGNSAERLVDIAMLLLSKTKQLVRPSGPRTGLKMAIHAGPVAAGVIGSTALQYQLYGPMIDTACVASRQAKEGSVVITAPAWAQLRKASQFSPTAPFKAGRMVIPLYEYCLGGPEQAGPAGAQAGPGSAGSSGELQPCAFQYWDLTYASATLEKRFCRFFSVGQIPLDLTFLLIVIVSQASWIHRWTFQGSYLYAAMIALMSFNLLFVMAIVYCRDTYTRFREPLVVTSHLFHKLIQLVVTVAPAYGTIHSPTYTYLVAILESSGCAGIVMLCFGLQLRFCCQLVVGAAILGMSMAVNRPICSSHVFAGVNESVCVAGMGVFQVVVCYATPSLLVYTLERKIRKRFVEATAQKNG